MSKIYSMYIVQEGVYVPYDVSQGTRRSVTKGG